MARSVPTYRRRRFNPPGTPPLLRDTGTLRRISFGTRTPRRGPSPLRVGGTIHADAENFRRAMARLAGRLAELRGRLDAPAWCFLNSLVPPGFTLPCDADEWGVAADYWAELGDEEKEGLCRRRAEALAHVAAIPHAKYAALEFQPLFPTLGE